MLRANNWPFVFGLERYGRPVIIEVTHDNGTTTLLPGRPVRDPYTVRAMASRTVSGAISLTRASERAANLAGRADKAAAPLSENAAALLARVARRTSLIGPLACLVASWFVARWLSIGADINPWLDAALAVFAGASLGMALARWHSTGRPLVRLGRWGALVSGTLFDRLLPDHRLVDATAGRRSVAIRLKDPEERVGLILDSRDATRSRIDEVTRVVSSAAARGGRPPDGWTLPNHLPSPGAAFVVAAVVLGLLASLLP